MSGAVWRVRGGRTLDATQRTLVMGVLNVTPDSFSDGGAHATADDARAPRRGLAAAGAAKNVKRRAKNPPRPPPNV